MELYSDRTFEGVDDRPFFPWQRGRVIENIEFRNCRFQSCIISVTADPTRRSQVRNARFFRCTTLSVSIYSLIAEEVTIEDLVTEQLLQTWGAVFKHVTLRGRAGALMISALPLDLGSTKQRAQLARANADFYATVDWALDITEAEFNDVDLRGVPGELIRRDPSTQVLVKRERACEGKWRTLDLSGTHWPVALEWLAQSNRESEVFVAGKRARNFKQLLDGLNRLRDAGKAEPE